ncbi:hypothetical protein CsSME_00047293 [Camellia sinensis var. sinensis]
MVETRRSSSSSKHPLSSPSSSSSSSLPNAKRSKVAEASSPCATPPETLAPAKESGCESRGQEARSSDPPRTGNSDGFDATVPEKSPDVQVEGEPLGDSAMDAEKVKSVALALNRAKKRQLKQNVKVAWGKLLSQYSEVGL